MTTDETKRRKGRRGNSEGTIFKRNGRWVGAACVGIDATGKPIRKWKSGKTRKEVQDKLDELRDAKREGFVIARDVVTVEDTVRRYLELAKNSVERNTYAGYFDKAEQYVIPHLGTIPVEDLTADHVDSMLLWMRSRKKSPGTQKHALGVLSRALKMAIQKRRLRFNVCDAVTTPSIRKREQPTLSEAQLKTFFTALASERQRALFVLLAQTGMRPSEALGLWWDAVNLETGELTVKRALVDAGSEYYIKPYGKTKTSSRLIKLSALAESELIDHKARMQAEGNGNSKWVFCNADGDHLRRRAVLQWLRRILTNAGLPAIPLKNLRHTAATVLLGRKWPLKTVADLLGHSNIQTTAQAYGQFTEGIHTQAVADLGEAMTPTELRQ